MKKNARKMLCWLIAGATIGAASCSDNGGNEGGGGTPIILTEGVHTEAFYKGDMYEEGTGNFWVNFVSDDMQYDEENETYIGPGYILCVDLNSALAADADFPMPETGTYTFGNGITHGSFSLNPDTDSVLSTYDEQGKVITSEFKSGTMEVSMQEGYYIIECDFITTKNEPYTYFYRGKISFLNRTSEGVMSNLTHDVTLEALTQGAIINYGAAFVDTADACVVILAGKEYDLQANYGASDAVNFFFNVALGAGASRKIPAGTYPAIDVNKTESFPVGTLIAGFFDLTYGGYYGAWYFSTKEQIEASLLEGSVVVTENNDATQTFTINLKDGHGHSVKGSYTGKMLYADASE